MTDQKNSDRGVRVLEPNSDGFVERLRTVMGSVSARAFAEICDISESGLRRYLAGDGEPGMGTLRAISTAKGVSLDWLVLGQGTMQLKQPPPKPPTEAQQGVLKLLANFYSGTGNLQRDRTFAEMWNNRQFDRYFEPDEVNLDLVRQIPTLSADDLRAWRAALSGHQRDEQRETSRRAFDTAHGVNEEPQALYKGVDRRLGDEFVYVPRIDAAVSAGPGAFLEEEQVRDRLAFRRDWIREMHLHAEQLALVSVRGDSMEPTLADRDLVLVDLSRPEIDGDGIYVIRRDGVLVVKRLQTTITGDIYIRSDNPRYSEERIPKEQMGMVRLVGRVVWLGRQM